MENRRLRERRRRQSREEASGCSPGYFFGMPESGWLVVSLLAPEQEFSAGVDTLIDYFRKHQGSNIAERPL